MITIYRQLLTSLWYKNEYGFKKLLYILLSFKLDKYFLSLITNLSYTKYNVSKLYNTIYIDTYIHIYDFQPQKIYTILLETYFH